MGSALVSMTVGFSGSGQVICCHVGSFGLYSSGGVPLWAVLSPRVRGAAQGPAGGGGGAAPAAARSCGSLRAAATPPLGASTPAAPEPFLAVAGARL